MTKLNCQQPLIHIILQKSFLYIDLVLKKHILLLPVLKTIFLWKLIFLSEYLMNIKLL